MTSTLSCEIRATSTAKAEVLFQIIKTCSDELTQPIVIRSSKLTPPERNQSKTTAIVTLELPVDVASTQHQAWCLACRIACFCPDARVSVLVLGSDAFKRPTQTRPEEPTLLSA